jgi:hypothetical protein
MLQNTPTKTPKLMAWIRIRGWWSAIQRLVILVGLDIFSIGRILAGCLSNIFFIY